MDCRPFQDNERHTVCPPMDNTEDNRRERVE